MKIVAYIVGLVMTAGIITMVHLQYGVALSVLTVAVAACFLLGHLFWKIQREHYEIIRILTDQGLPDVYMERLQQFVVKRGFQTHAEGVAIGESIGYTGKGAYEDAIKCLQGVRVERMKYSGRGIYYTCYAYNMLMLDRISEADQVFRKHIGEMIAAERDPRMKHAVKFVRALMEIKLGHLDHAEVMLGELYKQDLRKIERSNVCYWMGKLQEMKRSGEPWRYFQECYALAGETMMKQLSAEALMVYDYE